MCRAWLRRVVNWPCRCTHLELPTVPSQQALQKGQTNQFKGKTDFRSVHYRSIPGLQSSVTQKLLLSDYVKILWLDVCFFKWWSRLYTIPAWTNLNFIPVVNVSVKWVADVSDWPLWNKITVTKIFTSTKQEFAKERYHLLWRVRPGENWEWYFPSYLRSPLFCTSYLNS